MVVRRAITLLDEGYLPSEVLAELTGAQRASRKYAGWATRDRKPKGLRKGSLPKKKGTPLRKMAAHELRLARSSPQSAAGQVLSKMRKEARKRK